MTEDRKVPLPPFDIALPAKYTDSAKTVKTAKTVYSARNYCAIVLLLCNCVVVVLLCQSWLFPTMRPAPVI